MKAVGRARDIRLAYLLLAPAVLLLLTVLAYPVGWEVWTSLTDLSPLKDGAPEYVGFTNYRRLLAGAEFWRPALVTVVYAVVTSGAKLAFLTYAADNAISFGGGVQMTEGREAIGAAFDGFPAGAVLEWRPVAAHIAPSGDLGCTVGEARIASLNHYSKYLTIWRRQPDRTWKFVADGGNARPAP